MGRALQIITQQVKSAGKRIHSFAVALGIISLVIGISLVMINEVTGWVQIQNVSVLTSGMGAIGTLMLAWLTFQTIRQNEKLVQHQQRQLKHQQAESRPLLRQLGGFKSKKENYLSIDLQNIGTGTAYKIQFRTDIAVPKLGINTAVNSNNYKNGLDSSIPNLKSEYSNIYKNDNALGSEMEGSGGVLQAGSKGEFSHRIGFENMRKSTSDMFAPIDERTGLPPHILFTVLLKNLKDENIPAIVIQHGLKYEDVYGEGYSHRFPARYCLVEDIEGVSDLFNGVISIQERDGKIGKMSLQAMEEEFQQSSGMR